MDLLDWLSQRAALDIATSISLIGACAAFIYRESKESKRKAGEERERLRVEKLIDVIQLLEAHMFRWNELRHGFQEKHSEPEYRGELLQIYWEISRKVLPTIIMFGNRKNALEKAKEILRREYFNEFNENRFLFDLCIIKRDIMIDARRLMSSDENDNDNIGKAEDIIDDYLKEKYQIPPEIYNKNVLSPTKS